MPEERQGGEREGREEAGKDRGEQRGEKAGAKMPFFATGEVVGDYSLLYLYWRKAGEKAEEALLREEDFQALRGMLQRGEQARLDEVLERLKERFRGRVEPGAAAEAAREYYGVEVPPEEARDRVAGILAGWLVEAASRWGMIRLRRRWERGSEER